MEVTAGNNSEYKSTGAGYGLQVEPRDRNSAFKQSWPYVVLDLPNGQAGIQVRLSSSFWRDCPELRSVEIGKWLIGAGYGRWPSGNPPAFTLIQVSGNHFKVV